MKQLLLDRDGVELVTDLLDEYLARTEDMIDSAVEDDHMLQGERLLEMTSLIYRRRDIATRLHKELYHYESRTD